MTKVQAVDAMKAGKKVSHKYFTSEEWMTIEEGMFLFEDGNRCHMKQFWETRYEDWWNSDWRIWNGE